MTNCKRTKPTPTKNQTKRASKQKHKNQPTKQQNDTNQQKKTTKTL